MKGFREMVALAGLVFAVVIVADFYSPTAGADCDALQWGRDGEWTWFSVDAVGAGGDCVLSLCDAPGDRFSAAGGESEAATCSGAGEGGLGGDFGDGGMAEC